MLKLLGILFFFYCFVLLLWLKNEVANEIFFFFFAYTINT